MRRIAPLAALALTATLAACGSTPSDNAASGSATPAASSAPATTNPAGTSAPATSGTYTMADVQKHAVDTDCWTAINGNVYDVTSWISQHPGGPERIKNLCGKDGTAMFQGQHGGDGRPDQRLATFQIGTLAG